MMELAQWFAIYRLIANYLYADRYKTRLSRRATPKGGRRPWLVATPQLGFAISGPRSWLTAGRVRNGFEMRVLHLAWATDDAQPFAAGGKTGDRFRATEEQAAGVAVDHALKGVDRDQRFEFHDFLPF